MVIYFGKKSIISGKSDSQNKRLATRIRSEDGLLNMNRADIGRKGNRTKEILARFRSAILYLFSDFG